jgi:hypothetical protein
MSRTLRLVPLALLILSPASLLAAEHQPPVSHTTFETAPSVTFALQAFAVLVAGVGVIFMLYRRPVAESVLFQESSELLEPCVDLPPEMEAKLRQALDPDETLLWAVGPSERVTRMRCLQTALSFLLAALLVDVGMLFFLSGTTSLLWLILGLFVFVVFSFVLLSLAIVAPLIVGSLSHRTAYAVTDLRALVHRASLFGADRLDSYDPEQFDQLVARDWWPVQRAGDLVSVTRGVPQPAFSFLGIDEVAAVKQFIRKQFFYTALDGWASSGSRWNEQGQV